MSRELKNLPNAEDSTTDFPSGKVANESAPDAGDGTPINQDTISDFFEFFMKIQRDSGLDFNGLLDNTSNGHQFVKSLDIRNAKGFVDGFEEHNFVSLGPAIGGPRVAYLAPNKVAYIDTNAFLRAYELPPGGGWSSIGAFTITGDSNSFNELCAFGENRVLYVQRNTPVLRLFQWDDVAGSWSEPVGSISVGSASNRTGMDAIQTNLVALYSQNEGTLRTYELSGSSWSQLGSSLSLGDLGRIRVAAIAPDKIAMCQHNGIQAYRFDYTTLSWSAFGNLYSTPGTDLSSDWALASMGVNKVIFSHGENHTLEILELVGGEWVPQSIPYDPPNPDANRYYHDLAAFMPNRIVAVGRTGSSGDSSPRLRAIKIDSYKDNPPNGAFL